MSARKTATTRKTTIVPKFRSIRSNQVFSIAPCAELVLDMPIGACDPDCIAEIVGDVKAAYERAMARGWERFERKVRPSGGAA